MMDLFSIARPDNIMPVVLAVVSGFCFGLMGVLYKVGHLRSVTPLQLTALLFLAGTVVFGGLAVCRTHAIAPLLVWLYGLGVGCLQYLVIRLMQSALKLGPLSPLWCASNLNYIPPLLIAWMLLDERPTSMQWLGCVLGIGGVIIGAQGQAATGSETNTVLAPRVGRYLLVLFGLFVMNSMPAVTMKLLNAWPQDEPVKYMTQYRWLFLFLLYFGAGVLVLIELKMRHIVQSVFKWKVLKLGIIMAVCSMAGLGLLSAAARLPAAIAFPINSAVNIITAALISVTVFRERVTWQWGAMLAGVLACAILVNL